MNLKFQELFDQAIPYLIAGVGIALLVGLFILFSHLIFWGVIIGLLLWASVWLRQAFFSTKNTKGSIIEHDDDKK
jgi:hypothetical protein